MNYFSSIKGLLKHEGVNGLFSRAFVYLKHRIFLFDEYYVVQIILPRISIFKEVDLSPKIQNYIVKYISTNKEADALRADGYDFGAYEFNLRASLDKNVISFCIFVNKEIAHISCLADNPRGKVVIDFRPFHVDYQNGEVVIGRALTVPKFRRLHLRTYAGYLFAKYCRERELFRIKATVNAHNIAALSDLEKAPDRHVLSKCRFIKILWFKYFKETKVEKTTTKRLFTQMKSKL